MALKGPLVLALAAMVLSGDAWGKRTLKKESLLAPPPDKVAQDQCSELIRASGVLRDKERHNSEFESLREQLVHDAVKEIVLDDDADEAEVIKLAQAGQDKKKNQGKVSGGILTPVPQINDLSCSGSLPVKCDDFQLMWRTFSGVCNNLESTLLGSAGVAFRRFLPAEYADGVGEPRGGFESAQEHCKTGGVEGENCPCEESSSELLLPAPRRVSANFHPHKDVPAKTTHLFTIFGQFLDHDLTFTPETGEEGCCGEEIEKGPGYNGGSGDSKPECFPFFAQECDGKESHFKPGHCFSFGRSSPFCADEHTCSNIREQFNGITAYVDASNVYGSSKEEANFLRSFENGQLLMSDNGLLPILEDKNTGVEEERAGDVRARENPALAGVHTIFLREHNRLAEQFAGMGFSDDQAFLRARRLVWAQMQNVVYGQWLTALLGEKQMEKCGLLLDPKFDQYDESVDASIFNEFATAAFRFGHSMVEGMMALFSLATYNENGAFKLKDNFFDTTLYQNNGGQGFQEILLGLILQAGESRDRFVDPDLTDFLFANQGGVGSDLMARNIQRGRDHGLPGYNEYRKLCGLEPACDWDKPPAEIKEEEWKMLRELYNSPLDIDLWVGGISEITSNSGGVLGPTFSCLICKQFQHLKFGDRFFFTFDSNPMPFNDEQQDMLKKRNLGDIICDNTELEMVTKNVFLVESEPLKCGNHNPLKVEIFGKD